MGPRVIAEDRDHTGPETACREAQQRQELVYGFLCAHGLDEVAETFAREASFRPLRPSPSASPVESLKQSVVQSLLKGDIPSASNEIRSKLGDVPLLIELELLLFLTHIKSKNYLQAAEYAHLNLLPRVADAPPSLSLRLKTAINLLADDAPNTAVQSQLLSSLPTLEAVDMLSEQLRVGDPLSDLLATVDYLQGIHLGQIKSSVAGSPSSRGEGAMGDVAPSAQPEAVRIETLSFK